MTTTQLSHASGVDAVANTGTDTTYRVTQRSVVHAEWIKFRSVRSNLATLAAAGIVLVLFGALFSYLAGGGENLGPPGSDDMSDSMASVFGGLNLSQLVLGVLGAVFVAGEYVTGLIRTTFAAVPHRLPVLRAKAIVLGTSTWLVMTVASFVAFFVGQALYAGDGITYSITEPGVLRAVFGVGLYGAGVVVMGVALGFLLRSTAAAIGTLIGTLMLAPGLVSLLPDSISSPLGKVLPSNAGEAIRTVASNSDLLSPGAGMAVFAAWVVGLVIAAAVIVRRRDA
jgi:ABC-2 type transport system permease protein